MKLLLASTSPYRRALLQRLCIPFDCVAPGTDETPLAGESPAELSARLAIAKARAVAADHAGTMVLGSDQVASINGSLLGKPGTHERAVAQLRASSGNAVSFYTSVALLNAEGCEHRTIVTTAHFRSLGDQQIEAYLQREKPYDCAGSFKCEGLGIALFERVDSEDPTALEGLPLIATCALLNEAGLDVLA